MLSFIIPTRDRPERLALTLTQLARLDPAALRAAGGAEAIIVDNASAHVPVPPAALQSAMPTRVIPLGRNEAAASRNAAARQARGEWLIMLDDDSHPLDAGLVTALAEAPSDVAAIGAEILLPSGAHEAGGLPEVFIGCGVALRREDFIRAGGYDPAFGYYAEEYDLAARFLAMGRRIIHDPRFRVLHHKSAEGRNMNTILRRLVRNNGWVEQRYAPEPLREEMLARTIGRYRLIAEKERALAGFEEGRRELIATLAEQPRRELDRDAYDRFTGFESARHALAEGLHGVRNAAIIDEGKNGWIVRRAAEECGIQVVRRAEEAEALLIGTLSPGPIADALARHANEPRPVVAPWRWAVPEPAGRVSAAR